MRGICGWIAAHPPGVDAARLLSRMTQRLTPWTRPEAHSRHVDRAALGVSGGSLCDADGVWVAVEGDPVWYSAEAPAAAGAAAVGRAIAAAYRRHGAACLEHLHGSFSVAVLAIPERHLLLAIDRMGARSLYYSRTGDGLVFGSTTSSVAAHVAVGTDLNPQAVFDYTYFQAVPGPSTIYAQQQKLCPGQYLTFEGGRLDVSRYWRPQFADGSAAPLEDLSAQLVSLMSSAVRRASGNARPGSFLSGGIDSSLVSGLLRRTAPERPRAYTVGFDVPGYDEIEYARAAAAHFDLDHVEHYLTPGDATVAAAAIAGASDEPFGDSSALAVYHCATRARDDGVHVLLAGDGGDELFAGHIRYARQKLIAGYHTLPAALRNRLIEPLLSALPGSGHNVLLRKARKYVAYAKTPLPERCEIYNPMTGVELAAIYRPEFLESVNVSHPIALMRDVYAETAGEHPLNRLLHLDWRFTLAFSDLRKVGRMCDLAGVAVRYPWLDDDVVELSTRVPPDVKLKGLELRWFVKHALREILPRRTLAKSKQGFAVPFDAWLRTFPALGELAFDTMQALKRRGCFQPSYLDSLIDEQRAAQPPTRDTGVWSRLTLRLMQQSTSGHPSMAGELLWRLMMLELWLRSRGV